MLLKMNNLKLESAGNDGAAGGGSVLTSSNGGGAGQVSQGNGNSGNAASSHQASAGNASAGNTSAGTVNTDWKSALPKELQEEPSLKSFNDPVALAKSYVHAQKLIGADKIAIPSKHATEDDWKQVYAKLGLPADVKEYDIKFKEGVSIDENFLNDFKTNAHKAGILPKQAQALADWFSEANAQAEERITNEYRANQTKQLEALKTEWGVAFQNNLVKAQQVLREAGSPELISYLEDTGLGNDVNLIRLLSNIGTKFFSEGTEKGGRNSNDPTYTPKDAMKEINKIQGDSSHPFWVKDHPGHRAAVEEMQNLYKMAYPPPSTIDKSF